MKALSTRLPFFFVALCSFLPALLWANLLIKGSIACDGINIPDMASVRINAFDADGDVDDLMGRTYLTDCKTFEIRYEKKKWDPFPMAFTTWWRPDIFLTVEIYEADEWITVYQSDVYEDWKTNYDLELHIYVEFNEPLVGSTHFSPLEHGWPFHTRYVNKQSDDRLAGDLSGGLCFGALDRYYRYQPREFPTAERFEQYLRQRQAAAEKSGQLAFRYTEWSKLPDRGVWSKRGSIAYETKQELSKVRTSIDQGKPVALILIAEAAEGQGDIRQVIAYRYLLDQTRQITRLWLYDPDLIEQQEAVLTVVHGAPDGTIRLRYDRENQVLFRGFFINPYDRKEERQGGAPISM